ncbi:hypothetical protein EJB05_46968, partial [Eragrostis curvula]
MPDAVPRTEVRGKEPLSGRKRERPASASSAEERYLRIGTKARQLGGRGHPPFMPAKMLHMQARESTPSGRDAVVKGPSSSVGGSDGGVASGNDGAWSSDPPVASPTRDAAAAIGRASRTEAGARSLPERASTQVVLAMTRRSIGPGAQGGASQWPRPQEPASALVSSGWGPDFMVDSEGVSFSAGDSGIRELWVQAEGECGQAYWGVRTAYDAMGSALHAMNALRSPFEKEQLEKQASDLSAAARQASEAEAVIADLRKEVVALRKRADDAESSAEASRKRAEAAGQLAEVSAAQADVERKRKVEAEASLADLANEAIALRSKNTDLEGKLSESQALVEQLSRLRLDLVSSCAQVGMKMTGEASEPAQQVLDLPNHVRALEEEAMGTGIRATLTVSRSHFDAATEVVRMSEGFAEGNSPATLVALEEEVRPSAERLLKEIKDEFLPRRVASTGEEEGGD